MIDKIAKEISTLDFSNVEYDNTKEAIFNIAKDLYNLKDEQIYEVINVIEKKYIKNL